MTKQEPRERFCLPRAVSSGFAGEAPLGAAAFFVAPVLLLFTGFLFVVDLREAVDFLAPVPFFDVVDLPAAVDFFLLVDVLTAAGFLLLLDSLGPVDFLAAISVSLQ